MISPGEMTLLAAVVKPRSGLVLSPDKGYLVESRLGPVARKEGFNSIPELLQAIEIRRDEKLSWAVTEALTHTETCFFRDKAVFEQFRDEILPRLAAARPNGTVRVWSAACSTGQEPYSLAMMMAEAEGRFPGVKLEICASDISSARLEKAQSGLFTQFEVQRGLPIRLLVKHFTKEEDNWRIAPRVRQAVRWRVANLLDDLRALGRFDAILVRNVTGDFDEATRTAVLSRLGEQLAEDGVLVLGANETAGHGFEPLSGERGLYGRYDRKRAAA